jgi:hypothetical protein
MQRCKARTPRTCLNLSLSKPTKVTNVMEELERKNNDGGQPMTVRITGGKREEASSEGQ